MHGISYSFMVLLMHHFVCLYVKSQSLSAAVAAMALSVSLLPALFHLHVNCIIPNGMNKFYFIASNAFY